MNQILIIIGATITALWGVAHLFPTKSVVKGFGDISLDNKRIITMEWIIEGVALISLGILVIGVTLININSKVSNYVYLVSIFTLLILAIVSIFTGFKVRFLPFRICPLLFTVSSILIFLGAFI